MKFQARTAIIWSGLFWLCIGLLLLFKGMFYAARLKLLPTAEGTLSGEKRALLIVSIGLFLGLIKGRLLLPKAVQRIVRRITNYPGPIPLTELYDRRYLLLIVAMVALGLTLRFLPISPAIKGLIDVAVGSGLMNGSMLLFRQASAFHRETPR